MPQRNSSGSRPSWPPTVSFCRWAPEPKQLRIPRNVAGGVRKDNQAHCPVRSLLFSAYFRRPPIGTDLDQGFSCAKSVGGARSPLSLSDASKIATHRTGTFDSSHGNRRKHILVCTRTKRGSGPRTLPTEESQLMHRHVLPHLNRIPFNKKGASPEFADKSGSTTYLVCIVADGIVALSLGTYRICLRR